jgi:hypothetical protein
MVPLSLRISIERQRAAASVADVNDGREAARAREFARPSP